MTAGSSSSRSALSLSPAACSSMLMRDASRDISIASDTTDPQYLRYRSLARMHTYHTHYRTHDIPRPEKTVLYYGRPCIWLSKLCRSLPCRVDWEPILLVGLTGRKKYVECTRGMYTWNLSGCVTHMGTRGRQGAVIVHGGYRSLCMHVNGHCVPTMGRDG